MDNPSPPKWHDWEATYRGAVSIVLGGIPLLMVLPMIQVGSWVDMRGMYGRYMSAQMLLVLGGLVVFGMLLLTSFFGVLHGVMGWAAARRTGEPRTLCYAGIMFSVFAVLGWLWHATIWVDWAERASR